jgi:hypothetical protein
MHTTKTEEGDLDACLRIKGALGEWFRRGRDLELKVAGRCA